MRLPTKIASNIFATRWLLAECSSSLLADTLKHTLCTTRMVECLHTFSLLAPAVPLNPVVCLLTLVSDHTSRPCCTVQSLHIRHNLEPQQIIWSACSMATRVNPTGFTEITHHVRGWEARHALRSYLFYHAYNNYDSLPHECMRGTQTTAFIVDVRI